MGKNPYGNTKVHVEPACDTASCPNMDPHNHGFACGPKCRDCGGYCHKECPAN